jgi:hypothetical protein
MTLITRTQALLMEVQEHMAVGERIEATNPESVRRDHRRQTNIPSKTGIWRALPNRRLNSGPSPSIHRSPVARTLSLRRSARLWPPTFALPARGEITDPPGRMAERLPRWPTRRHQAARKIRDPRPGGALIRAALQRPMRLPALAEQFGKPQCPPMHVEVNARCHTGSGKGRDLRGTQRDRRTQRPAAAPRTLGQRGERRR